MYIIKDNKCFCLKEEDIYCKDDYINDTLTPEQEKPADLGPDVRPKLRRQHSLDSSLANARLMSMPSASALARPPPPSSRQDSDHGFLENLPEQDCEDLQPQSLVYLQSLPTNSLEPNQQTDYFSENGLLQTNHSRNKGQDDKFQFSFKACSCPEHKMSDNIKPVSNLGTVLKSSRNHDPSESFEPKPLKPISALGSQARRNQPDANPTQILLDRSTKLSLDGSKSAAFDNKKLASRQQDPQLCLASRPRGETKPTASSSKVQQKSLSQGSQTTSRGNSSLGVSVGKNSSEKKSLNLVSQKIAKLNALPAGSASGRTDTDKKRENNSLQMEMSPRFTGNGTEMNANLSEVEEPLENNQGTSVAATAISTSRSGRNVPEVTARELMESYLQNNCQELSGDVDIEELRKINKALKDSKTCKVCRDKDSNRLFLPCAHLVACSLCTPALTKCPLCKGSIRGIVSVFFTWCGKCVCILILVYSVKNPLLPEN